MIFGTKCCFIVLLTICIIIHLYLSELNYDQVIDPIISKKPTIFAITPTYARVQQTPELIRLSHVVMLVPNIHWIIVEDAHKTSKKVKTIIQKAGLVNRSTILCAATPSKYKSKTPKMRLEKPRGVIQRNTGLNWIRSYIATKPQEHSIIYFMDDDNTYSVQLFEEMSKVQPGKVGIWAVAFTGGLKVQRPMVCRGRVNRFNSVYWLDRLFPTDMASFAIATDLLRDHPQVNFNYDTSRGHQESVILMNITMVKDLQPIINGIRNILVWHTRSDEPELDHEDDLNLLGIRSDDGMEMY